MLSIRDALGSRWNANWTGWAILFVPTSLLTFLQEANTPFPSWGFVLASAVAQHISSLIVAFVIATPLRRTHGTVPLGGSVAIWLTIGIARGIIGGLFAEAFAGVDAGYLYRVFSWVLISTIWMPLFVYTMAQFDHRRELLVRLSSARDRREAARERHAESAAQFRRRVLGTVQEMIAPALEEVRVSLAAASAGGGSTSLEGIGERLTDLAGDAARIVDTPSDQFETTDPPQRSLLIEAVKYEVDRPIAVALLTGLSLLPAVLLGAIATEGPVGILGDLTALVVGVAVLAGGLSVLIRYRERLSSNGMLVSAIALTILGGTAASATLLLTENPLPLHDQVLAIVFPIGFGFAASVMLTAVSVAFANEQVAQDIVRIQEEAGTLGARSRLAERRLREQVSSLMHGPVHGRLAACAMALNFLADEGEVDATRSAEVAARVLDHLTAASTDLEVLAKGGTHVPSRP